MYFTQLFFCPAFTLPHTSHSITHTHTHTHTDTHTHTHTHTHDPIQLTGESTLTCLLDIRTSFCSEVAHNDSTTNQQPLNSLLSNTQLLSWQTWELFKTADISTITSEGNDFKFAAFFRVNAPRLMSSESDRLNTSRDEGRWRDSRSLAGHWWSAPPWWVPTTRLSPSHPRRSTLV